MIVAQLLKSKGREGAVTITPDARVGEAAQLLSEKKIGAVVVSEDGVTAKGILSERDICRGVARKGSASLDDTVDSLMTADIVTCGLETRIEQVMAKMTGGRFRHVPVVEDGKLIGVVSIGDVVKAKMDELTFEKEALQDMIMGR